MKRPKLLNAEELMHEYDVIVTNSKESPEDARGFCNKRACCENFVKRAVYGFGSENGLPEPWGQLDIVWGGYAGLESYELVQGSGA